MPTDHRARVEEMLAEYRRSREQLGAVQRDLAAIEASARSDDGSVRVTVGSRGVLTDLTLSDEAYRAHAPSRLASLIVELAGEAARSAAERSEAVLEPVLPTGTDPAAVLGGRGDLEPSDPELFADADADAPAAGNAAGSGARRESESEDGPEDEQHSWLQDSLRSRQNGAKGERS